ncbi:lipase maturation factor family protein [Agromyces sp. C10]|uniref:lipase maturation factor family protein n=1 Tax=Agromyces sp. C10 TaxID=2935077 RepID=UPI00200AB32D|nr:lipase maturation factor family protein [Agromyces sp. C10]MCK8607990.1 lipase maturation factor family protein [Agromyces sp. C10]
MDWGDWFSWFDARDADLAREVLQRGIAALFLVAFLSTLNQFRPLLGERGLLPVPELLEAVRGAEQRARDREERAGRPVGLLRRTRRLGYLGPTIFRRWGYRDARLVAVCAVGMGLAASVVVGLPQLGPPWVPMLAFLALWALYLSIVSVGQTFYGFGWEMLLCEAGFLVAFLGSREVPPPLPTIVLVWWLVFRLEFGAGMIKIRGGREWRDLTALMYHHETQPMPGPLSRRAHLLPAWFHRLEVLGNHAAQLVVPFLLFAPQPIRTIAAAIIIATQLWLVITGNFAWLNWITIVLAFGAVGDEAVQWLLPWLPLDAIQTPADATSPPWWIAIVLAVAVLIVWLSRHPLMNLFSKRQLMNASFDRFMLVNAYGAFGTVTKERVEIIVEGTVDDPRDRDARWREYGFKGKPGDPARVPRQFAPYHLRLDWLMWFLPLGRLHEVWFLRFLEKLLEADAATLRLLAHDPFDGERPRAVRARTELFTFATREEHRRTGHVWMRHPLGTAIPPITLGEVDTR